MQCIEYLVLISISVDYDAGQQIALGGEGTVPRVLPTFADVLAAFPTWQGQVALFVPNKSVNKHWILKYRI